MEPPHTNDYRSGKRWLIGCLSALLLFPLAGAGVSLWSIFTSFRASFEQSFTAALREGLQPMKVSMDFVGNLRVGNLDAAYALTTEEFQRRQSLEEFAEFVRKLGDFRSPWLEPAGEEQTADSCGFWMTAETNQGTRRILRMRLQKEKGEWKVNELVLP